MRLFIAALFLIVGCQRSRWVLVLNEYTLPATSCQLMSYYQIAHLATQMKCNKQTSDTGIYYCGQGKFIDFRFTSEKDCKGFSDYLMSISTKEM